MKKTMLIVLLITVMVFPAFAGGQAEEDAQPTVAFSPGDMANPSQSFSAKMFREFGPDYGFEVTILDGKGDAQVQSQTVTNAIAQDVEAIYVNPNDVNAIIPSLRQAKEAGLIVGMFSSDVPEEHADVRDFFVGVDDLEAGETAAQAFIDEFPDGAKVVEIGGQSGHDAQIKRHDGFNQAIEGTNIEVLAYQATQQWATDQAMAIAEDMITKYGEEIDGIFCHWDNGVTGVANAVEAADLDKDLFVVGVDGNKAGFQQVREGIQDVTIMQNFETQAKRTLELTKTLLEGGEVDSVNYVALDIVTQENIDDFTPPEW
ncbi:MAG: sugar ABC transporter substrate-binding protein [Spirochaetota bacterium]